MARTALPPMRGALTTDVGDASNFALAAFRQAITEWDPSGTFAAGMRAMCEGFEHGPLPPEDQAPLAALILCAEQALARAAVPLLLSERTFGNVQARLADLLRLWAEPVEVQASWHSEFAPGFRAMIRMLANEVENVSLQITAYRGLPEVRRAIDAFTTEQQDGPHADVPSATRH
ncbi:MAG: hypothetical protein INR70_00470 [Parafilimonas terrae]|nr:hypothetical protein [Parafilimonas terrae]